MKTMRMSQVVAGLLLVLGVGAVTRVVLSGPFEVSAGTLGIAGTQVTFGVYLDLLSASLLAFVASIALIVSVYAGRNLRGQRRLVRFGALLTLSFGSLSLMVTGASLPMIALGWTVSGLLLSGLVAHRAGSSAQRAGAAVRRQLLVGDALLWTGVVAAFVALPTLDRAELAGAEIELIEKKNRALSLKKQLDKVKESYDYVLIDCPPSLSLLTINALTAADSVLIPIQCEFYALEGVTQLIQTVDRIRETSNPNLSVEGIVMTMADTRTNLSNDVVTAVHEHFPDLLYKTMIPRSVRLGEAPSYGEPIIAYDPKCKASDAYRALSREVKRRAK